MKFAHFILMVLVLIFAPAAAAQEGEPTVCPEIIQRHTGVGWIYAGESQYVCEYFKVGTVVGEEPGIAILKSMLEQQELEFDGMVVMLTQLESVHQDFVIQIVLPDDILHHVDFGVLLAVGKNGTLAYKNVRMEPDVFYIIDMVTNEVLFETTDGDKALEEILLRFREDELVMPLNWVVDETIILDDPVTGASRTIRGATSLVRGINGQVFFVRGGDVYLSTLDGAEEVIAGPGVSRLITWLPVQEPVLHLITHILDLRGELVELETPLVRPGSLFEEYEFINDERTVLLGGFGSDHAEEVVSYWGNAQLSSYLSLVGGDAARAEEARRSLELFIVVDGKKALFHGGTWRQIMERMRR